LRWDATIASTTSRVRADKIKVEKRAVRARYLLSAMAMKGSD
jgi:hypothetical protein